jgi:hypothetical protein
MTSVFCFKIKKLLIGHLLNISYPTISFTLLDCRLQHSFFSELDLTFDGFIAHGYHVAHNKLHQSILTTAMIIGLRIFTRLLF